MTQTAEFERKDFTSVPNIIYDGYSELKPLDRHVAATLLRRCYMAGWHALSMRDIEDLSGVPHNLMRSIETREGILNRLQRVTENIFNFKDGATANRKGRKGRPQTYVCVDTARLWKANTAFYASHKAVTQFEDATTEDAITVSEGYSHPTKGRRKTVSTGYSDVSTGYSDVSTGYSDVSTGYTSVSDVSVNVPPKKEKNSNNSKESKEVNNGEASTTTKHQVSAIASTSSQSEETENSYSRENQTTTLYGSGLTKRGVTTDDGYRQKEEAKPEQGELLTVEPGPLVMPPASVKWCAKTAVVVSEVLRGKRYTEDQAKNQHSVATRMFKVFPDLTREQFETVFKDWATWWRDHHRGVFTLADIMAKKYGTNEIRLRTSLDQLESRKTPVRRPSSTPATPEQKPTVEPDQNKPVVWTRYKHQGAAIDHWYLYAVMPLSEALQYGYMADMIPPSYRMDIKTLLKSLAEGRRELTPEQKAELETAELRPQLHLVA